MNIYFVKGLVCKAYRIMTPAGINYSGYLAQIESRVWYKIVEIPIFASSEPAKFPWMLVLLRKEINSFFSNVTGYLVIMVFLVTTSLFLWVFPGNFNILDSGYAHLKPLFELAPWVFLFLVPALTMRLFADEKRSGTIEILFTRPLSDLQVILAKYLAGLLLVILAILPTLIYVVVLYQLGDPPGNIDMGAVWGSYLGLLFLAAVYTAIGVFASSITENQVVAFLVAVVISFLFYAGWDALMQLLGQFPAMQLFLSGLSLNAHYESISRGVVDSRDVIYFIALSLAFILFTRTVLESRKW